MNVNSIALEITVIVVLILINGVFALSEMALVSCRRPLLLKLAEENKPGAKAALTLTDSPNVFLSTIQIGITLVAILAGAFGGATLADELSDQIEGIEHLRPYADSIAFVIVVVSTTYLSLIVGELVPKRIALSNPEGISCVIAPAMKFLSHVASPVIKFLSLSTNLVAGAFGVEDDKAREVSEREIQAMVDEGARVGVFQETEHDLLCGVFGLDDRKVSAVMTPVTELIWLDVDASQEEVMSRVFAHPHTKFPVARGSLDNFLGVVRSRELLTKWARDGKIDLEKLVRKPLMMPDNKSALNALADFRRDKVSGAMVVDEHGSLRGLVTVSDILSSIVGDVQISDETVSYLNVVAREDGGFLVDGMLPIAEFKKRLSATELPDQHSAKYETVAGLIVHLLGHVPSTGEVATWNDLRFEVIDMDGFKIDKVAVSYHKAS
ncbi:MAG TPA: hemolysin family protein [Candidatus Melainabacteria bacterium]|nr:hemolysin family protein [Candidatus Melainabacteria bacterium]